MRPALSRPAARLLLASLLPPAACCLQWLCWPLIRPSVWLLFYPVVLLNSWPGGFAAGLVATTLSTALGWCTATPPEHTLVKAGAGSYLNAAIFAGMGFLVLLSARTDRRTNQRAAKAELRERDDLLDRTSRLADVGGWD